MIKKFPHFKQVDVKDCGPTCIKIIARFFNKNISIQYLRGLSGTSRQGSSLLGLSEAAEKLGFRTLGVKLNLNRLIEAPFPCILHWNNNHYVVLYKARKSVFFISDPAHGLLEYNKNEFLRQWIGSNASDQTQEGIALLLEPTAKFYDSDFENDKLDFGFKFLSRYLFKYKSFLWQLVIGLIAASLLQLIFPFLTQSVVDVGIKNQDIHFVYLILFAQLAFFIGRTAIEVIRSWILLHLSTRINISLVSDFFIKLMNLPIAFFDTRMTGDILQRINDHKRIERILTTSSLNVLFSLVNLVVFSFVLAYYSLLLFGIFLIGSFLYFVWIIVFLKKRRDLVLIARSKGFI
jgi:ATP-binding cassette subfamily B protein